MKTTLIILSLSAAIAAVMAYTAPQATITEVSVLRDVTETRSAEPEAEEILPLYGTDKWQGRKFRYGNISDVDYNRVRHANFETAVQWFSNEFAREEVVENFNREVEKILADAKNDSLGKNNTSAYLPIAMELNRLAQSKAGRKILIVYSDLMENGLSTSFYGKNLDLLKNSPDSMLQHFQSQMPLENLNGITVHLIYQPLNNQDSERFRAVSEFYKIMLESKGGKVNIGANLVL